MEVKLKVKVHVIQLKKNLNCRGQVEILILPESRYCSLRDHPLQYFMDVWKAISRAGGVGDSVKRILDLWYDVWGERRPSSSGRNWAGQDIKSKVQGGCGLMGTSLMLIMIPQACFQA